MKCPRHAAALQAGFAELPCDVRQGGLRDAILRSVGFNATHGLRRTNADKRRAVLILLHDELVAVNPATGGPWSDQEVSRRCAVSPTFVGTLRRSLSTVDSEPTTRAYWDRHGNVTRMGAARIGRRAAEPAPRSRGRRPEQGGKPWQPNTRTARTRIMRKGHPVWHPRRMIDTHLTIRRVAGHSAPRSYLSDKDPVGWALDRIAEPLDDWGGTVVATSKRPAKIVVRFASIADAFGFTLVVKDDQIQIKEV